MNSWKPILAALVIFSAGLVTGRLTVVLEPVDQGLNVEKRHSGKRGPWSPPGGRDGRIKAMADKMSKELHLTEVQSLEVETIVRETHEEVGRLAEGFNPKIREAFQKMDTRLREILTPEQAVKFDEMMRARNESWKARREGGPNGPSFRPEGGREPRPAPPANQAQESRSTTGSEPL